MERTDEQKTCLVIELDQLVKDLNKNLNKLTEKLKLVEQEGNVKKTNIKKINNIITL